MTTRTTNPNHLNFQGFFGFPPSGKCLAAAPYRHRVGTGDKTGLF
jgi:hypothetical protein